MPNTMTIQPRLFKVFRTFISCLEDQGRWAKDTPESRAYARWPGHGTPGHTLAGSLRGSSLAAVEGVGPSAAPQTCLPSLTTTPGHPWELGLEDATRTPRAPPSPPTSGSSAHLVLAEPQGRAL